MQIMSSKRFIISGGGTGGHIFPALSIAAAIEKQLPEAEILFVGAEGRMEMESVPAAGYRIIGLPVAGFDRRNLLKNISVLWKLRMSLHKAGRIIRDFNPHIAIGVGGFASGPVLRMASRRGIPTLLQEQNSYAGLTNKLLAKKARLICVAWEGMEKYFPAEKILLTGNPVRQTFENLDPLREKALQHFGLQADKPVLLVLGGSLGARTINESLLACRPAADAGVQVLWQSGKLYYERLRQEVKAAEKHIHLTDFITRMDYAYAVADVIISRAGAGTISELCLVGKPVILVPSPNVAEDHQTRNAMALTEKQAARMVRDAEALEKLVPEALQLIKDTAESALLSKNIKTMALRDAADRIAAEAIKLTETDE